MNALECIGRLLKSLDTMIILEEVLPFLVEIQCSEAEIVMALLGQSRRFVFLQPFIHYLLVLTFVAKMTF